jgi:hypothetical protein
VDIPPRVADAELWYVCDTKLLPTPRPNGKPNFSGALRSVGGKVTVRALQ